MKSLKSSGKPKKLKALLLRRVVGKSMLPLLRPGQVVVASGLSKKLLPDMVVIVHHDRLEKIKRISKVKDGRIFVEGDNKRLSVDSRSFGWLPTSCVVAKIVWPRI